MDRDQIDAWLRQTDNEQLDRLWLMADQVRSRDVGEDVHLRGLIEFSNHCSRLCGYCGLRAENVQLRRYRMSESEIVDSAHKAVRLGFGTVVLQSGEDPGTEPQWMAQVVRRIKKETELAVTLSLGERAGDELALWRDAGADRYLLRFETSNRTLFDKIHPSKPDVRSDRMKILRTLDRLGYEVGSGVMIGIPGQTYADLARDIELFAKLGLHMIGVGPYVSHPGTPLGAADESAGDEQVPNSELMVYKVLALTRLVCPRSNIPSTTALATVSGDMGHELGLKRGANVIMPNVTPIEYRRLYQIYPNKAYSNETDETCYERVQQGIEAIGRTIGVGRGDAPSYCDHSRLTGKEL